MLRYILVLACACALASPAAGGQAQPQGLTLAEALRLALDNSPTLAVANRDAVAAQAAALAAGLRTPPTLELAPNLVGSGGSEAEYAIVVPLELGSRLTARARAGRADARAAEHDTAAVRRTLIRDVRIAYWALVSAQSAAGTALDAAERMDDLARAVKRQVDLGAAPAAQVLRTDLECARARQVSARADAEVEKAQGELARLIGKGIGHVAASDAPRFREPDLDEPRLLALAAVARPEVKAAAARAEAALLSARLVRADAAPQTSLQMRGDKLSHGYAGLAFVASLPLVGAGEQRRMAAGPDRTAEAKALAVAAAQAEVRAQVDGAARAVRAETGNVKRYSAGIIDRSEQIAALARKGYERGAATLLEVLDAQRTLREVKAEHAAALATLEDAIAQLEWACGMEPGETEKETSK